MIFPRLEMSITEIHEEVGTPKRTLYEYARRPKQKYAWRYRKNGKWWFNTEQLAKEIEKDRIYGRRR